MPAAPAANPRRRARRPSYTRRAVMSPALGWLKPRSLRKCMVVTRPAGLLGQLTVSVVPPAPALQASCISAKRSPWGGSDHVAEVGGLFEQPQRALGDTFA